MKSQAKNGRRKTHRLFVESLEPRNLLATAIWEGESLLTGTGSWADANNWAPNSVPGDDDTALFKVVVETGKQKTKGHALLIIRIL